MEIYDPVSLNELGQRSNNEDAILPVSPTSDDTLFLVCDGVGGNNSGEVASELTTVFFQKYFSNYQVEGGDTDFLESALHYVEYKLKKHVESHPENMGMATTLTLLFLDKQKQAALVGWIGDSRIYHIRDGEILFQSKDHSEVQSLIDMEEITEEEARHHPRRNIITRAIKAGKSTRIDQKWIHNLQSNDFFLLCTDGILENLDNDKIRKWFTAENSSETIRERILNGAQHQTKDNFSMQLIKLKYIDETSEETVRDPHQKKRGNFLFNWLRDKW